MSLALPFCCSNGIAIRGHWADTGVPETQSELPFSQLCSALEGDVHKLFVDLRKPGRKTSSPGTSQDMTQPWPLPPLLGNSEEFVRGYRSAGKATVCLLLRGEIGEAWGI